MRTYVALIALLLWPAVALGWPATVIKVYDGDTITVAPDAAPYSPQKIRLYGIDAPEMAQAYGQQAAQALQALLPAGARVDVEKVANDRYRRTVGIVTDSAGRVVNLYMLGTGNAWYAPAYCKRPQCPQWEHAALSAAQRRAGLWRDDAAQAPWEWRRARKNARPGVYKIMCKTD